GQMNRIFAQSRIIDEVAINNGGDEISYENYWTSNELNFFQSWYFSMVYGYSDAEIKDEEFLVRPVRNFTVCEPEIEYIESKLSYKWNSGKDVPIITGQIDSTVTYTVTATTLNGCYSTASKTLVVQQDEKVVYDRTICSGEIYQDEYFNESESGYYEKIIENDECNQVVGLNLKILDSEEITKIVDKSCQGGAYSKHGFSFTPTVVGVIYDTLYLKNQVGCDSIIELELEVLPMSRDTIYGKVCQNEAYDQNGFAIPSYQPSGISYFERVEVADNQCPYILILALSVDSLYQISIVDSACQSIPYTKNGFDVIPENAGYNNYYLNLKSSVGCDSIVALNLRVLERFETIFNDTIILGEKYQSKDFDLPVQLEMGTRRFEKIYTSDSGCDSVIILNLTILDDEGIFIPNSFTPLDGNGKNDHFMEGYELFVYDRYGLLICHTTNGWDGKYRGEYADPGVYVYTLIFKSGKEKHGVVEILKP
ncbi:MAG: gliding motility-associated C-terminal domain-containing protein, partial [Paludibacteraceae bacterium]|nr:gliding motility-associated C-terminal domain-containing protein [Paludibacteraceae bacterium]